MSAAEAAVRLAALSVLEDRVKVAKAAAKTELAGFIGPGDRITARLTSGAKVGAVTYTEGRRTASVTDEAAFLEWVFANHPDEIVSKVNDAYRSRLLDYARNEAPSDPVTGEVIPGITVTTGQPYLTVKPTTDPEALAELVDAIRAPGELALDGLPSALPQKGEQ